MHLVFCISNNENSLEPGTVIICPSASLTGFDQKLFSGNTSKSIMLKPTNTFTQLFAFYDYHVDYVVHNKVSTINRLNILAITT